MGTEPNIGGPDRSRASGICVAVIALLVLYLLPLILVAIDDVVLRTHWFARTFPDGARAAFYAVYPFVRWIVPY